MGRKNLSKISPNRSFKNDILTSRPMTAMPRERLEAI